MRPAMGGVMAPPRRPPPRNAPKAVDRSEDGIQRLKADAIEGENAASSAPKVKRIPIRDAKLQAYAVRIVKTDQPATAKLTKPRAPYRSAAMPHGVCPRKYERLKMLKTSPICACERSKALRISGPATAMQTRSV